MLDEIKANIATEKEKIKQMNGKEKLQYFRDYYLLYVSIAVIVIAIVVFLVVHFVNLPEQPDFYAAFLNCEMDNSEIEKAEEEIQTLSDGQITYAMLDVDFNMNDNGLDKLQVYASNNRIDIIIMERDLFVKLAGYGFFADLQTVLPENLYDKYSSKMISAAGYKDTGDVSFEDNETGKGELRPYGIDMSTYELLPKTNLKEPVLAISASVGNLENTILVLENTIK